jgi:membrane-bound lytic murein transglycosylase A
VPDSRSRGARVTPARHPPRQAPAPRRARSLIDIPPLFALLVALASCTTSTPPPPATATSTPPAAQPEAAAAENARLAGVRPAPPLEGLGIAPASAARALAAFRVSCPSLVKRSDPSQLARPEDWVTACAAAADWPDRDALSFFATHLELAQVGEGSAFATGYFEPRIAGSRSPGPGYAVPIYGVPDDLIEADLSLFSDTLTGRRVRGRVEKRKLIPYHDRAAIEAGALAGRGLEIAWAADPIDMFFLEIQGSGQLELPGGEIVRIGYAGQNGREYVAIGKLMKERGLLAPGGTRMQAIVAWLRAHPAEGRAIMRENKSQIFFRLLDGTGPLGALGHPVTPRATVAADPKFVPLGAPVVLVTDRPEANGIWVAQDTGGAIKGANRFDTFWGAGDEAARLAGGMSARGRGYVFLPRGTIARLQASDDDGTQARN